MIAFRQTLAAALILAVVSALGAQENRASFELTVLPPEHKKMIDPRTGADLVFLTTNLATDTNLYFHERSWLADGSLIFFSSARENGGPMAYLVETGELVRLASPKGPIGAINAAKSRNRLFGRRGDAILEWCLSVEVSTEPRASPSKVTATERVVARLPEISMHTPPSESCDGRHLAVGAILEGARGIVVIDVASGEYRELCSMPKSLGYGGHVQWSRNNPHMLSFAGRPQQRLMVIDIHDGIPKSIYTQRKGELVTHEHWWAPDSHGNDQIVFCGGLHREPNEDAHVKVINLRTGVVRILGAGAWWPHGQDEEIAKQNFWHCSGSENGRWVAADNWHGDITIFEGKTTRPRRLTAGHRTYGQGEHPHVGWDREGKQVVFTSHMLGNPNVCIATIPEAWQQANP